MSEVLTEVKGNVLVITLNRPEAKNAANKALADGVAAAIDQLEGNDDLRVAVITGAGGTFCSGMDLKAFVSGEMPMATITGVKLTQRSMHFDPSCTLKALQLSPRPVQQSASDTVAWFKSEGLLN